MKIGIIPAGGKSERWNGFPKEMMPTGNSWTLLDRMILLQTRALVDKVVIVSSTEKFALHEWWIDEHKKWPGVDIAVADSIMDAIQTVIRGPWKLTEGIFGMPDTYSDNPMFPELHDPLELGLFKTKLSHRFGMLRGDQIVDKEAGEPGRAWGAFMFNEDVAKFWVSREFEDHTDMLNQAMRKFNYGSWTLNQYVDIASYQDYVNMLRGMNHAEE